MNEMQLFGNDAAQSDFAEFARSRSGIDEAESFWGTLTFVLMTIAVDC